MQNGQSIVAALNAEFRVSRRDIKLDSEPFNKRWLRAPRSNKTFAGVLACSEATEPRRINGRVIMKRDAGDRGIRQTARNARRMLTLLRARARSMQINGDAL